MAALNLATRKTVMFDGPPKEFNISTGLSGMKLGLSETIRLVDSFYEISSVSQWRIMEQGINTQTGQVNMVLSNVIDLEAFYLDVHNLDGSEYLL